MDAQKDVESDPTKPSAASPSRRNSDGDSKTKSQTTSNDARPNLSPPSKSSKPKADDHDADADDHDSDAETIVLPGKDGHSPSKIRKVRQEDKNDNDADAAMQEKATSGDSTGQPAAGSKPSDGAKRRRLSLTVNKDKQQAARSKDGSSGLSSAPASPPRDSSNSHRRRRSNASPALSSESENTANHVASARPSQDKSKAVDRLSSAKRKAPKTESDDEDDYRKARRQRTISVGNEAARAHKDRSSENRNRSTSPPPQRLHRRSASTQLLQPTSGGFGQKKQRRAPPPLQSTEQNSDDSDESGSPHPRSSKLRSLATPGDSNMSPAKIVPHKKHLDAHGQTLLARACARGEYDSAKQRLGERPDDLNVADYAGNTPLQIAAINGCEDIVKLLIEAGCNLDCVNYDKDTPLLDAVDNGHLGVVKLLLHAGVNPRKANVSGQEPVDRVTDETENAEEIRKAIMEARKNAGDRRRTSEDRHSHQDNLDARDSHAPDSPRHSPAAPLSGSTRRGGTVRSTKTRNDLLYMPLNIQTLRQAAGRGDGETVGRILQVQDSLDDPESMVAAARGGHPVVIELLLGLGGSNPDPAPVPGLQPEFGTPILAAIGQENIKVVELLLEQGGFDPTRRFKGETYYEIARRRQGTNWKEEEHLLKNAYDEYKRSHKDGAKPGKSPGRRERERGREEKRARKSESIRDESRPRKRNISSPVREHESKKKPGLPKPSSPKERRRLEPGAQGDESSQKKAASRHIKDDKPSSAQNSDRESSPAMSQKPSKIRSRDTDPAAASSDGEAVKPRRKLVSKGELRGEREKHRRSSMASNASSLKEPSSPRESRYDDSTDKSKMSEKYHDRTKALKREESKDTTTAAGESNGKRHRSSVTPDRQSQGEKDDAALPLKRRRLDGDGQEKRPKHPTSPEARPAKLGTNRDNNKNLSKSSNKTGDDDTPKDNSEKSKRDATRKESGRTAAGEHSVQVKSEDVDVAMPDADSADAAAARLKESKKRELAEQEEAKKQEERRKADAKKEEERKHDEAKKEEERKRVEAEEKKKREEEEAKRREAAERERKEKEEKLRLEEEARKKEEEERRKQEEERKRKEEEQRKKQEEEERLHREQLEREAAEAARRKREEEERKERERRERAHREEMERKRAAREAEQRRLREEQERARLEKLPPLMHWLEICPNPKTSAVASRFYKIQGCRYDTINPDANGTAEGRELWALNTDVALLLGEKDLSLSRYSAWEHVPVSLLAKKTLWRTEWPQYSLAGQKFYDLGRQVPGHFSKDPLEMRHEERELLKEKAWEKFVDLPMFFVKVSELLYTVPQIPHLRDVKLGVNYRELVETEGAPNFGYLAKWKGDPDIDRYRGFCPRWKWYINGALVGEDLPKPAQTSKTPFVEKPVPRRGLQAVLPDDPDYVRICQEQGIVPQVKGLYSPTPANVNREDAANTASKAHGVNGDGNNPTMGGGVHPTNGPQTPNGINGSVEA